MTDDQHARNEAAFEHYMITSFGPEFARKPATTKPGASRDESDPHDGARADTEHGSDEAAVDAYVARYFGA